jgi:hypothetical protein
LGRDLPGRERSTSANFSWASLLRIILPGLPVVQTLVSRRYLEVVLMVSPMSENCGLW